MSSDESRDEKRPEKPIISDGELQSLHEMIAEALMTSGNTSQLDSVYPNIPLNQLRDQIGNDHNLMYLSENYNDNEDVLTLGKLYVQFKNLDIRLSRVEDIILSGGEVKIRALPMQTRSNYNPCYGLNEDSYNLSEGGIESRTSNSSSATILNDVISINPILTNSSSNEMLSLAYQEGSNNNNNNNNNDRNRNINNRIINNNNNSSSAYSLQSFSKAKIKRKDEIKRSELDHYCLPLLENYPKPTTEQLLEIVNSIGPIYPNVNSKQLLSKVREWFRKRREYMSQRIFQACSETFRNLQIQTEEELELNILEIRSNSMIIKDLLKNADLEITNDAVARDYCLEKVISYLNGLYRPSSKSRIF